MIGWLFDTLIASSLLMAIVLCVREPVRRSFGPAVAYGLWLLPALRLITPPLTWTVERPVQSAAAAPSPDLDVPQAAVVRLEAGYFEWLGGWAGLAVAVWLAGAGTMLLAGLLGYRRQRRDVLRSGVETGRIDGIRMVRSAAVRGPMAFGIFDRVIALPLDFVERYSPEEQEFAIAHELAHHRSGDLALNLCAFSVLCLHWFNPLAWLSHAAFRFDQESACDARVLRRAGRAQRAAYAQAIAKAASGRMWLGAGALDRPGSLHRRIGAMRIDTSNRRGWAGRMLIAVATAMALPLTASWATRYVDGPEATAAEAGTLAAATGSPRASATRPQSEYRENADGSLTLPGGVTLARDNVAFFSGDRVFINGRMKTIDQLTPPERARLRAVILEAQREQARERVGLPQRLAELERDRERARSGRMKRDMLQDREELRRDLAEIDAEAAELRARGENPEDRRAELRQALREVEAIDIDAAVAEVIEGADPERVRADLRESEDQMRRMLARLAELDRR